MHDDVRPAIKIDPSAEPQELDELRYAGTEKSAPEARRLAAVDYIIIALCVGLVRAAFSWGRTVFYLAPDEFAVGGMARYLSGTGSWNMLIADTWRPGLSTLLAPIPWFTSDPELFVRLSLIVNAAIAGLGAVYLARLAERLTLLSKWGIYATVVTVCLMPASLSASAYVWAEPLVTLTFLACLWNLLRLYDHFEARFALTSIAWAVVGFTAHGRLLPLVALATCLVCIAAIGAGRRVLFAVALSAALAGTALSSWYANVVFDATWESRGGQNSVGGVLRRLRSPIAVIEAAMGQFWYLLVTTLCLSGIGLVVLLRAALRWRAPGSDRRDALILLVLTIPMLFVSIVFMSGRTRSAYTVYGRYNDAILGPILIVAIAWLVVESRTITNRAWWWIVGGVGAVTLELGLLTNQLHGHRLAEASVIQMIAGLQPLAGDAGDVDVVPVTLFSLVIAGVLFASARILARPVAVLGGIAVLLLGAAGLLTRAELPRRLAPDSAAVMSELVEEGYFQQGEPIMVSLIPERFEPELPFITQRSRVLLYQWYLAGHPFGLLYAGEHEPGTAIFATSTDPYVDFIGATKIWSDPVVDIALWRTSSGPASG